jgi:hypothetical protein
MTDVACFCGCLYSFDGGAGGCPRCGEYATVSTGSAFVSTERGQQYAQAVPATSRNGQNGHTVGSFGDTGGSKSPVSGQRQRGQRDRAILRSAQAGVPYRASRCALGALAEPGNTKIGAGWRSRSWPLSEVIAGLRHAAGVVSRRPRPAPHLM